MLGIREEPSPFGIMVIDHRFRLGRRSGCQGRGDPRRVLGAAHVAHLPSRMNTITSPSSTVQSILTAVTGASFVRSSRPDRFGEVKDDRW